jgi:hypothetical protein
MSRNQKDLETDVLSPSEPQPLICEMPHGMRLNGLMHVKSHSHSTQDIRAGRTSETTLAQSPAQVVPRCSKSGSSWEEGSVYSQL